MYVDTDLRILGGGSAGCLAALAARIHSPAVAVTILEKGGALSHSEGGFSPLSDKNQLISSFPGSLVLILLACGGSSIL